MAKKLKDYMKKKEDGSKEPSSALGDDADLDQPKMKTSGSFAKFLRGEGKKPADDCKCDDK